MMDVNRAARSTTDDDVVKGTQIIVDRVREEPDETERDEECGEQPQCRTTSVVEVCVPDRA